MPAYSLLIPMYRSSRFLDIITEVVASHLSHDCEILLSDQHCLDNALDRVKERFSSYSQLRYFASKKSMNWVQNINLLIRHSQSGFFRIAPHDDSTTGKQSDHLLTLIQNHPEAVLASGAVKSAYLDEDRKDGIVQAKTGNGESDMETLKEFNWQFLYNGAFKGMIRKSVVTEHDLYILPTPTSIWSERLWLNALRMLGPFIYSREVMQTKRFYRHSTHQQWKHTRQVALDNARVLDTYIDKFIPDPLDRQELKFSFWQRTYKIYLDRES